MALKIGLKAKPDERPRLTKAAVLDAGLALADADGLEALTIRRLAQDLGVTPMALYWHFKSKDELLEGLGDRVMAAVDLSVDPARSWLEQFEALVRSFVAALRLHPCAGALLTACDLLSERTPHLLAALEAALDILRRAGFSTSEATQITLQVMHSAIALVESEPGYGPGLSAAERQEAERRTRVLLETLPPDRYPRINEAAVPLASCDDPDAHYAFGVELLLGGVQAMAARIPH
jgi:AcrR family transcriptional regulator